MSTTRSMLREWFLEGVRQGATHMIVRYDSFDGEDYPEYVKGGDVRKRASKGERVMEVYALHLPFQAQARERRSFHYESAPTPERAAELAAKINAAQVAEMWRWAVQLDKEGGVGKFLSQELVNRLNKMEDAVRKENSNG